MAQAAAAEDRARAEGHQIQACLALGVTVLVGGIVTANISELDSALVAGVVAFSIWLLALVGTLHWSEMTAFATKRSVAEDRVASMLDDHDAQMYRQLLAKTKFGPYWWIGLGFTILICGGVFAVAFMIKLREALGDFPPAIVILAVLCAIATVALAVASGLIRRSQILRHVQPVKSSPNQSDESSTEIISPFSKTNAY